MPRVSSSPSRTLRHIKRCSASACKTGPSWIESARSFSSNSFFFYSLMDGKRSWWLFILVGVVLFLFLLMVGGLKLGDFGLSADAAAVDCQRHKQTQFASPFSHLSSSQRPAEIFEWYLLLIRDLTLWRPGDADACSHQVTCQSI